MKKFRRSAGVIIKHGDKVLLCKRSPKESLPNQAAIREVHEETNIELTTDLDLVGMIDTKNEDGLKTGMMFVFLQETKDKKEADLEKASHGKEHTTCKYFESKDIPKQKNTKELYDILKKILK
jgi:ADP-ribose pyrophosphatase YjhB (NUDIX family)